MAAEPEGKRDTDKHDAPEFVDEEDLEEEDEDDPGPPVSADHPMCPQCGWSNTRLSHTRTMLDEILQMVSVRAFRCRSCHRRFRKFQRRS